MKLGRFNILKNISDISLDLKSVSIKKLKDEKVVLDECYEIESSYEDLVFEYYKQAKDISNIGFDIFYDKKSETLILSNILDSEKISVFITPSSKSDDCEKTDPPDLRGLISYE